jgi:hypothetical protein
MKRLDVDHARSELQTVPPDERVSGSHEEKFPEFVAWDMRPILACTAGPDG